MKGPVNSLKVATTEQNEGKQWPQILVIIVASLPSLTCGILFTWASPSIPLLIKDKINYDITLEEASYLTVIPPIAALLSSPIFSWLVDKVGRKPSILFLAIPHLMSWVLIAFAKSIWVFYLARAFTGIGDSCLFASLPIYVSEIATPKVRGSWGNSMTFCMYVGQLWINVVGGYMSIQNTAFICMIFPVVFICLFPFAPESPYYYLMKGRHEDARNSLKKLRWKENVEDELMKLQDDVRRQLSESGNWKDLFTIQSNRKALYAGIFLRTSQQLSGAAAISVYTQYILEKAGGRMSPTDSAALLCTVLVIMNVFAASVLDKIGRRLAMMLSLLLCSVSLYIEMIYFYINEEMPEINTTNLNWLPLVGLLMYIIFFQIGGGIVPTLMLGELFSQSIKGKGLCFLNVIFGLCVSSMTKLFQVLQTKLGFYAPFGFFATCCLVNTFLAYYLVPETKGKTLEEIQQSLKGNTSKKKNECTV